MPEDFRKFKREIEAQGYFLEQTKKGHFWVLTPTGGKLILFAVGHGANTKAGEVDDNYLRKVRKYIKLHKGK